MLPRSSREVQQTGSGSRQDGHEHFLNEMKELNRERTDAAIRTMLEGYVSIVSAAKMTSRGDVSAGRYMLRAHTAAMARASDELVRIASEIGNIHAIIAPHEQVWRPQQAVQ